jgi:HNH endonuclease
VRSGLVFGLALAVRPRLRLTVQYSEAKGSRLRRQLPDCLTACTDRGPRGLLVHTWSADSQPRTISLGTGLSCPADHRPAGQAASDVVRGYPPGTAPDSPVGHAAGTALATLAVLSYSPATLLDQVELNSAGEGTVASKEEVQGEVRRRDRFQCQMCGAEGEQYAHIVPESDGGTYELDNLIFLCWRCHNTWQEPARSAPEMKAKLIEVSRKLRDKDKSDGVLSSVFQWVAEERLKVTLGGGMEVVDQERILERRDDSSRPYLRLRKDSTGILHIDAYFDDADGNEFMHIDDNVLRVHTSAAWDIVINRRKDQV